MIGEYTMVEYLTNPFVFVVALEAGAMLLAIVLCLTWGTWAIRTLVAARELPREEPLHAFYESDLDTWAALEARSDLYMEESLKADADAEAREFMRADVMEGTR